jgi:hypothetical protein
MVLYVREKHSLLESSITGRAPQVWYWADGSIKEGDYTRPRPSIHMPRWASRLTLKVNDVKVERLKDISEEDAKAEGVRPKLPDWPGTPFRLAFRDLWNNINGPDAWDRSDWVVAISFDVIRQNVDEYLKTL